MIRTVLWQLGSNENTNGLLRGFFPKGTDFNQVNKKDLPEPESSKREAERNFRIQNIERKIKCINFTTSKKSLLS